MAGHFDEKAHWFIEDSLDRFREKAALGVQSEPPRDFIKDDTEKTRMDLLDPDFVEGLATVLTHGAQKYAPYNWRKGAAERYIAALLRHTMALMRGEVFDPDSGLPHAWHIGCNAMFLDYLSRQG